MPTYPVGRDLLAGKFVVVTPATLVAPTPVGALAAPASPATLTTLAPPAAPVTLGDSGDLDDPDDPGEADDEPTKAAG